MPPAAATVGAGAAFLPPADPAAFPLVLLPIPEALLPPACELGAGAGAPLVIDDGPPLTLDWDLGLVVYDASLGKFCPFLELVLGVPEARFLFLMTSVFNDNGRTTPWSL